MKQLPSSWQELSKSEDRAVTRVFKHGLEFGAHKSENGSSTILEPNDSVTFELRIGSNVGMELCDDYLEFFRSVVKKDDFIIAYDFHHTAYKFWPHQDFEYDSEEDWPMPPFPDGDYHTFFASNLKSCLFGFPWKKPSICVIGNRFIEGIRVQKPRAFGKIIRKGGRPI